MVKRHGGGRSVSLVKIKTTPDILGSKLTWRESRRTGMIRSYSWISEERRNALATTYQTALQPPGGVSDGGKSGGTTSGEKADSVIMEEWQFIWLWLWNSAGFYLATALTAFVDFWARKYVLVLSRPLLVPLLVAYNVSGGVISPSSRALEIGGVGSVMVLIIWSLVIWFWKWVQSKRTEVHGPKSGLVWEGFTTLDQARGVAPKGYVVR